MNLMSVYIDFEFEIKRVKLLFKGKYWNYFCGSCYEYVFLLFVNIY